MRSGRGKCPQCKEIITVDLDAQEIRCPLCNALLKKSAKTVAEVRAEEEARKAALAPEPIVAAETTAATPEETPAPVRETVPETVAPIEPGPETPAEETAPEAASDSVAESTPETATPEAAPDEIGISDEELAMMDETPAGDITAAEELSEPVDEIGISDEELAMMDESDNAFLSNEETPASESDEPIISGSISAEAEDMTPEESAEAEDAALPTEEETEAEEEAAAEHENVTLADDADESAIDESMLVTSEETPAEALVEEAPSDASVEETPVEDALEGPVAEEPIEESIAEESAASAEPPAPEILEEEPAAAPAEELALEEESADALTLEEEPAEASAEAAEDASADNVYVPTEEDMAFAATLSDTGRHAFVAPTANAGKTAKKAERNYRKKPEKAESSGEPIYNKVVAILMMVFSILSAAFYFLYVDPTLLLEISDSMLDVIGNLPVFGGDNFSTYVDLIFYGSIAVIAILGLTGKKGKLGFLFVLLADLVYLATIALPAFFDSEKILEILLDYGQYITYAVYGLLLVGFILFLVSFLKDREEYGISRLTLILPAVYGSLLILGAAFLALQPRFLPDLTLPEDLERYLLFGVWGAAVLITLVGVHSATASRGTNAWLAIFSLFAVTLVGATLIAFDLLDMIDEANIIYEVTPVLAPIALPLIGTIGLAASDLRN